MQDAGEVREHLVDLHFLYVPVVGSHLVQVMSEHGLAAGMGNLSRSEQELLVGRHNDQHRSEGTGQDTEVGSEMVEERMQVVADTKVVVVGMQVVEAERRADFADTRLVVVQSLAGTVEAVRMKVHLDIQDLTVVEDTKGPNCTSRSSVVQHKAVDIGCMTEKQPVSIVRYGHFG